MSNIPRLQYMLLVEVRPINLDGHLVKDRMVKYYCICFSTHWFGDRGGLTSNQNLHHLMMTIVIVNEAPCRHPYSMHTHFQCAHTACNQLLALCISNVHSYSPDNTASSFVDVHISCKMRWLLLFNYRDGDGAICNCLWISHSCSGSFNHVMFHRLRNFSLSVFLLRDLPDILTAHWRSVGRVWHTYNQQTLH